MAAALVVPVAVITIVLVKLALIIMMLNLWWLDAHSQCGCDTRWLGVRHSTLHKYAKVRYVDMMTNGVEEIAPPSDDDKGWQRFMCLPDANFLLPCLGRPS